jgi:hypothetical protein
MAAVKCSPNLKIRISTYYRRIRFAGASALLLLNPSANAFASAALAASLTARLTWLEWSHRHTSSSQCSVAGAGRELRGEVVDWLA